MSERPLDANLTTSTDTRLGPPTSEEVLKFRAKAAQVLDRSILVDKGQVPLPAELCGYWCPNDAVARVQAEMRGYSIDHIYAKQSGLNEEANGETRMGDVVFMTRPKWMDDIEKEEVAKRYYENHIRDRRKKEEKDFESQNELPTNNASTTATVSGEAIAKLTTK